MTDVISVETNLSPGRFRKQKARVNHAVRTHRKQQAEQAALAAKSKDRFHHTYAERVRLIRQMKTVLGYPLIAHEGFEYKSPYYTSKTLDDELVKKALRYWDSSVPASQFDGLMSIFEAFWEVESWVLQRATLIDYVEWKGDWFRKPSNSGERIPTFENPYWMSAVQVDMSDSDWHKWKARPMKEVLQTAIDAVTDLPTNAEGLITSGDLVKAGGQLNETLKRMQASTADGMVWNGTSSEHFTPRRSLWARIKSRLHEMLTGD